MDEISHTILERIEFIQENGNENKKNLWKLLRESSDANFKEHNTIFIEEYGKVYLSFN